MATAMEITMPQPRVKTKDVIAMTCTKCGTVNEFPPKAKLRYRRYGLAICRCDNCQRFSLDIPVNAKRIISEDE